MRIQNLRNNINNLCARNEIKKEGIFDPKV